MPAPCNMQSEAERLTAARDALLLTLGGPPLEGQTCSVNDTASARQIPVTVFSGFLGAGKTTLLCQLLERSSIEILAIVNDIASINVDAALVRARNTETIELDNGCACCVLGSDLRETLYTIGTRAQPPDAIVIEASGLSDPIGIAQTVANVETMTLDGIVTVVDALSYLERASDPATAHLFERQLAAAHLIALTKATDGNDVDTLRNALGHLAPGRPVLVSDQLFEEDETGVDVLLGAATRGARPTVEFANHNFVGFAVETLEWLNPICASDFFASLDKLPSSVYRVKGWVWLLETGPNHSAADAGPPARFEVQAAGSHWRVAAVPEGGERSQLVVIGRSNDRAFETFLRELQGLRKDALAS